MNKYVRKLFEVLFKNHQIQQIVYTPLQHTFRPPEEWRQYWQSQGQPWRTEPEIGAKRQEELRKRRAIVPDIEKGIYPFKGMKLSRADVEWLLAGHENGRGPVDWSDETQYGRQGLDLRGADLRSVDLRGLPLAGMQAGLTQQATEEQCEAGAAHLENADLGEANLERAAFPYAHTEGADLSRVNLKKANLTCAHLEDARLHDAYLEGASFYVAHLERAGLFSAYMERTDLREANLEGAFLCGAHLEGANLRSARLERTDLREAYLGKAILTLAYLDEAFLDDIILNDEKHIGPLLADVRWGNANLAVVKWSLVNVLGDEHEARQKKRDGRMKERRVRLREYEEAVRANRQLGIVLQAQGLNRDALRFTYRAQVLEKHALGIEMILHGMTLRQRIQTLGLWLFSWFLYLLAGYGYKPLRSLLAYLFVIIGFAASYFLLGLHDVVGPHHVFGPYHLTWFEAIVVSMTAFHGRGFFANQFQPGDPQAFVAAFEAFVGLLIEVTLIATLTRRLFGQ